MCCVEVCCSMGCEMFVVYVEVCMGCWFDVVYGDVVVFYVLDDVVFELVYCFGLCV